MWGRWKAEDDRIGRPVVHPASPGSRREEKGGWMEQFINLEQHLASWFVL
jgi:hypothetical protein